MRLFFASEDQDLRPTLPWRPGSPPIDLDAKYGDVVESHFLLIEDEGIGGPHYRTVHAEVHGTEDGVVWYEKVPSCSEDEYDYEGNSLTNVVCHSPYPRI